MKQKRIWIVILIFCVTAYALGSRISRFLSLTIRHGQHDVQLDAKTKKIPPPPQPTFQDYPAAVANGPFVPPRFNGTRDRYKKYHTAIKLAVNAGPNFAGHFTIVEVGCGTSCTIPFIVDLSDGRIFEFPSALRIVPDITYEYKKESTLLVALWPLDMLTSKPRCKRLYYQIILGNFVKIEETTAPGQCHF